MKRYLVLPLCLLLGAYSSAQLSTFDADAVDGLSLINTATSVAIASGAIPKGNVSNIVTDANTISSGLETVLTGQPLTSGQVSAVAASFHSNSATTSYATLATPIVNALVSTVNAKLAAGATASQAKAAGVQVLVNAPAAVQAATITAPTTAS